MRAKAAVLALILATTAAAGLGGYAFHAYRTAEERRFQAELAEIRDDLVAGRLPTALRKLRELAERRPDSGEVHYLTGICELGRGRPEAAERAWARVKPGDAPHFGNAALHWAEEEQLRGQLAPAEDRLRDALREPGSHRPGVRWALVQLLRREGRLAEASRLFADGLAEHPEPVEAIKVLYKFEVDPFPLEAARQFFEEAARQSPQDDRVWLGRAYVATQANKLDEAEALLRACRERRPDDRAVWEMWLAWALAAGRPDAVREALAHLPATPDDAARLFELRAWVAARAGDRDAERRALEGWLEAEPANPGVLERLAGLAIASGEPDKAAAYRARRLEQERTLDRYRRRLWKVDLAADAKDLAEMARALGRRVDLAFWLRNLPGGSAAEPDPQPGPAPAGTLAEAAPDLVAGLEALAARPAVAARAGAGLRFEDRAESAGLRFVHESVGPQGRLIPPISMSGGVALLDFDRDGRLDVYCVQSGRFPPGSDPDSGSAPAGDRLFRNNGDGTFADVSESSGIAAMPRGYGHGVAVGDVDNDGFPDLFVTRWRGYALYRNNGDGTFADATESWGLGGDRDWPTSAAFADLDNDGDLDLYVCHYLAWDEDDPQTCVDPADPARYACNPRNFPALPDHLFRNDGGTFVDVSDEAGITAADGDGRGLGVLAADLDGDGRVDLSVANDMSADYLFLNRGGFRFEERGHEAGVAGNADGGYQAGMGLACGDVDADGRPDLAVTNFYGESTTLFRNLGDGLFVDETAPSGLKAATRFLLGFGVALFDADNDGTLDLLSANGHVHDARPQFPFGMPLQLLAGAPGGRFVDASADAGPPFGPEHLARGLAIGDLDGDGRLDAVVQAQNEPALYLHNGSTAGHSLTIGLEGTASNRDGVGAVVTVTTPKGRRLTLQRFGGGSYQSAHAPTLHAGLGEATRAERVEVRWPSGRVDTFEGLPADAGYLLREGAAGPAPLAGRTPD